MAKLVIERGDRVRITACGGWCEGTVLQADDWGGKDGWYVELTKEKASPGWDLGYGQWKQGVDGGTIEVLEKGVR